MSEPVVLESKEGVALMRINSPHSYNSFDLDTARCLAEGLMSLARDHTVGAVVITGSGKAFCTGGDLRWVATWGGNAAAALHNLAARFHQSILEIRHMAKPVVAAVNGPAAGGGFSLALACDFRVMESSALLRQAYTSNGLSIDGGGTFTLPRLVGWARAMEIAAFDRPIDAHTALEWGLVTEVVEDGGSVACALDMAAELSARSLSSFAASKALLNASFDTPLEVQLEHERARLASCGASPDGREGVAAFLEKRRPVFSGRPPAHRVVDS